jgi:hypothetical protein
MRIRMRRILLLPLLALAAPLVASAQPDVRDHRPPPPNVRDHRPAAIHKIEPASGAVGSTITLHGELPAGAVIQIGRKKVTPTATGEHKWEVIVPELRPGAHELEIEVGGAVTKVGMFEVTAAAAAAAPPPPPPPGELPPPPPGEHRHREWRLEWPVISSFWPPAGRPGTRVVVRGRNLPPDAKVLWNGTPVAGIAVEPAGNAIGFEIPKGATTGMLTLHTSRGRDLPIGEIQVGAADPVAEWKRIEDERRRRAEAAWAERERDLAKDQAARAAMYAKWQDELAATREQRRERELAELRAKWDRELLGSEEFQAEMTLHAQRVAELERMRKLAEQAADRKIGIRIELLVARENDRHDQRVGALKATFKAK